MCVTICTNCRSVGKKETESNKKPEVTMMYIFNLSTGLNFPIFFNFFFFILLLFFFFKKALIVLTFVENSSEPLLFFFYNKIPNFF
jgi:hypothetical protein